MRKMKTGRIRGTAGNFIKSGAAITAFCVLLALCSCAYSGGSEDGKSASAGIRSTAAENAQDSEASIPASETTGAEAERKVLFSLYDDNNPWPIALAKDVKRALEGDGITLDLRNAGGDPAVQYADISALKKGDVDMVLLSAVDMEVGADCIEHCREEGLLLMLIARNADGLMGSDYITLLSCDYELVGYTQALSLTKMFGEHVPCRILELSGDEDSSATRSLSNGFRRAIRNYANFSIVGTQHTGSNTRNAMEAVENFLQSGQRFEAVFCHSDADALGAIQALKTAGYTPGCSYKEGQIIITSNGGFDDAIKAVSIGELYSTIDLNARLGDQVLEIMKKHWDGQKVIPRIWITYKEIRKGNIARWIGRGY